MTDVAAKLASDFLAAQGWCCILITQLTASVQCIVTVGDVADRDEPGNRIWLARQHADKVVASFLSRCELASRRARGGLTVKADASTTVEMIRDVAGNNYGYAVSDDGLIDEQLAMVCKRIEAALERMQKDGSMKMLNRYYRGEREAARTNGTAFPPKYDIWLADRLRPALRAGLC
jgi:hypothetical protein